MFQLLIIQICSTCFYRITCMLLLLHIAILLLCVCVCVCVCECVWMGGGYVCHVWLQLYKSRSWCNKFKNNTVCDNIFTVSINFFLFLQSNFFCVSQEIKLGLQKYKYSRQNVVLSYKSRLGNGKIEDTGKQNIKTIIS